MVLDESTVARLVGAAALVIGTVTDGGRPHASRAWSAVPDAAGALRVVIDADDTRLCGALRDDARVALTAANVRTLTSLQVKGRVVGVEDLTALDEATRQSRTDLFLADVAFTDRVPRSVLDALVPARFLVCVVEVDEVFDQTPGPAAGRELAGGCT